MVKNWSSIVGLVFSMLWVENGISPDVRRSSARKSGTLSTVS